MALTAYNRRVPVLLDHHAGASPYLADLDQARKVQQQLYPCELPCYTGWDFAATCRPARIVGGDYCDMLDLGAGHIAFALGDVSGKGLGPGLVMAGLRALVHARLRHRTEDLAVLMDELNAYLLATTPDDMFVTLFLGVVDLSTGWLRYANAGHIPPLVLTGPDAEEPLHLSKGGLVLGILPAVDFEEHRTILQPGNLLAVFSDGITEATNQAGKIFHERRVMQSLREGWDNTATRVLDRLLEAVERFAVGLDQADDISAILALRLK